jgi:predicted DsbA family dithiol-disulfide isomerase
MRFVHWFMFSALVACGAESQAPQSSTANAAPQASGAAPATATAATATADGVPDPVASIGGEPITRAALDERTMGQIKQIQAQIQKVREDGLDQLINDRLLDAEAKKRGVSVDDLKKAEIDGKIPAVSDAEVEKFFNENQSRFRPGSDVNQLKGDIARYLRQEATNKRTGEFYAELRASHQVKVFLEPLREKVEGGNGARKGKVDAPVQIVEFSDFECPYCTRGADVVRQVLETYGDKVAVTYRHFPLPFHANATLAAQGAECARDQEKFWEYHDKLFANQKALLPDNLKSYATELGLDAAKFNACLDGGAKAKVVADDLTYGQSVGMSGTPGFYINGRMISGAQPFDVFKKVIDDELARKGS